MAAQYSYGDPYAQQSDVRDVTPHDGPPRFNSKRLKWGTGFIMAILVGHLMYTWVVMTSPDALVMICDLLPLMQVIFTAALLLAEDHPSVWHANLIVFMSILSIFAEISAIAARIYLITVYVPPLYKVNSAQIDMKALMIMRTAFNGLLVVASMLCVFYAAEWRQFIMDLPKQRSKQR